MSLLKKGLRSDCDYPVYRKRNVIPILMTHYTSLLTDSSMKVHMLLYDCTCKINVVTFCSVTDIVAYKASKFAECCRH